MSKYYVQTTPPENIKLEYLRSEFLEKVNNYLNMVKNATDVSREMELVAGLPNITVDFEQLAVVFEAKYQEANIDDILETLFRVFGDTDSLLQYIQKIGDAVFTETLARKLRVQSSHTSVDKAEGYVDSAIA